MMKSRVASMIENATVAINPKPHFSDISASEAQLVEKLVPHAKVKPKKKVVIHAIVITMRNREVIWNESCTNIRR